MQQLCGQPCSCQQKWRYVLCTEAPAGLQLWLQVAPLYYCSVPAAGVAAYNGCQQQQQQRHRLLLSCAAALTPCCVMLVGTDALVVVFLSDMMAVLITLVCAAAPAITGRVTTALSWRSQAAPSLQVYVVPLKAHAAAGRTTCRVQKSEMHN